MYIIEICVVKRNTLISPLIESKTPEGHELLKKVFLLRAEWGIRFGIRDKLLGTTKEVQPYHRLP